MNKDNKILQVMWKRAYQEIDIAWAKAQCHLLTLVNVSTLKIASNTAISKQQNYT